MVWFWVLQVPQGRLKDTWTWASCARLLAVKHHGCSAPAVLLHSDLAAYTYRPSGTSDKLHDIAQG
jgi:hypothetical protein